MMAGVGERFCFLQSRPSPDTALRSASTLLKLNEQKSKDTEALEYSPLHKAPAVSTWELPSSCTEEKFSVVTWHRE